MTARYDAEALTARQTLLACPFCGADDVAFHPNDLATAGPEHGISGSDVFYAHCDGCGAEGPQADNEPEAVENWNKRALPRSQAALAAERSADGDLRERISEGLKRSDDIRAIGTSTHATGYGPPYGPPWFIVDTLFAEPEVNYSGELIYEAKDVSDIRVKLQKARVDAILALVSPALAVARWEAAEAGLDLSELRRVSHERQQAWCPDQVPDLSFRGVELAGETGEACNVIKKLERERLGWRGSRATLDELADELADVVICADLAAKAANVDLSAAVVRKFNATSDKVGLPHKLRVRSLIDAPSGADGDQPGVK